MVLGLCTIEIQIAGSRSLKEKRSVLRSVESKVRQRFNVSIAEVDQQDSRDMATLAVACVSSSGRYANGLLERVVDYVDGGTFDLVLLDYRTELI